MNSQTIVSDEETTVAANGDQAPMAHIHISITHPSAPSAGDSPIHLDTSLFSHGSVGPVVTPASLSPAISYVSCIEPEDQLLLGSSSQVEGSFAASSGNDAVRDQSSNAASGPIPPQPYGASPYPDAVDLPLSRTVPILEPYSPMSSRDSLADDTASDMEDDDSVFGVHQDQLLRDQMDLLPKIEGLYRLLDLYSELGNGGLVDKIIIDLQSLPLFINRVLPGAYKSVTKIDFGALDNVFIKPVGVYGSKSEIVRFLCGMGAVSDAVADLMLSHTAENEAQPHLRSGIYAFIPALSFEEPTHPKPAMYIIYWPEETTWDDNALEGVSKNRVTFIRYLTRLTDQIRVLLSPEHAASLVWKDLDKKDQGFSFDISADFGDSVTVDDRFFTFEVAKTKEQEEAVDVGPGFTVWHPAIAVAPSDGDVDFSLTDVHPPRILTGESTQGFTSSKVLQSSQKRHFVNGSFTYVHLRSQLQKFPTIIVASDIGETALMLILKNGDTQSRTDGAYDQYVSQKLEIDRRPTTEHERAHRGKGDGDEALLRIGAQLFLMSRISESYPLVDLTDAKLQVSSLVGNAHDTPNLLLRSDPLAYFYHICATYPDANDACERLLQERNLQNITFRKYADLKTRFLAVQGILQEQPQLTDEQRDRLAQKFLADPKSVPMASKSRWSLLSIAKFALSMLKIDAKTADYPQYAHHFADVPSDPSFLASLPEVGAREPVLCDAIAQLHELATSAFVHAARKIGEKITDALMTAQRHDQRYQSRISIEARKSAEKRDLYLQFRQRVKLALNPNALSHNAPGALTINSIGPSRNSRRHDECEVRASYVEKTESRVDSNVWLLEFTENDLQQRQCALEKVPRPRVANKPSLSFSFPSDGWAVRHLQVIGSSAVVLVADTQKGVGIWVSPFHGVIPSDRPNKALPPFPGEKYVVAVDEKRRLLAFVGGLTAVSRCSTQLFSLDEVSKSIRSRGNPFNLAPWYQDCQPDIVAAAFLSGTEDLCLVEASGRIRVFSFVSQTFRPAFVQLESQPLHVQSSPDGSALLVIEGTTQGPKFLRVLHEASFGHNDGIALSLPSKFDAASSFSVTALGRRGTVYLVALSYYDQSLISISLEISKKETEYRFQAQHEASKPSSLPPTQHNSVLDCFSEVWGRYPVISAIERDTISAASRLRPTLTYVCDVPEKPFREYFKLMIKDFERVTRKPTGKRLDNIHVEGGRYGDLDWRAPPTSEYHSGEWLAELLCLIPIHIAVARENRFIPLKDGLYDQALEQQLLGASVSRIIDSLSLGWYESLFNSYFSSKPVKVISSMGEQSVGKSYSLNHIVDSSFAGSAVRTTEGVWLSVCPTRNNLVVALDFEGVHSIERTAQEDMLLVLFNTALSNLVLFRNNFALSRDVANMFTSFQASTHLFDPAANPKLFKGLLAVVIKDVVDADKREIVKEFSSKFHQIVLSEQANNFISVLHSSKLTVIPWSVIQSREFYSLFTALAELLNRQETTHSSAGEFLITIKTLMAKLKAQDWGSIDATAIKHRMTSLSGILTSAFTFGREEEEPDAESLKNLDDQSPVPNSDTSAIFYLGEDEQQLRKSLAAHLSLWEGKTATHETTAFQNYLDHIGDCRIEHVRSWAEANTSRFPPDNADVRAFKRLLDDGSQSLRSNLQLCLLECSSCRLRCALPKSHRMSDHDCCTSHECRESCSYSDDHENITFCGLPAGHEGRHICNDTEHVCGEPCYLRTKKGCQKRCMLPADHPELDHLCSTNVHQCGEACDVRDMKILGHDQPYSCPGLCSLPYNDDHSVHCCENIQSCPIKCSLCQRYCATGDHFHGLGPDAMHFCGQEHSCSHLCEAQGICEVSTTPRSVETTFTGRRATFQYTKYTQVAKRLACAVPVPSGERMHSGPHVHTLDAGAFHFCERACVNCGYICTLPLGHQQAEHDTAHGSMEHTAWAIEGNADAVVEIQGRTFAAQDAGAPQLCSLVCRDLGRHAHLDYCRSASSCIEPGTEHITAPMQPHPDRMKDWVSHKVFWARAGFRDPYGREDQAEFALCDARCSGPEHTRSTSTAGAVNHPSFCTLPIFHPPYPMNWQSGGDGSHVSNDGHHFACPNPTRMRQSYHVIFALDISGSMRKTDRQPIPNQPATQQIVNYNNNRFGAVLSALYGFWVSRSSASARRDAYSVITFDKDPVVRVANDFTSEPNALLARLVQIRPRNPTDFDNALLAAQGLMENHWSMERAPILVFLTDGLCPVKENVIHDLCNRAVALGMALSIQSVSFGPPTQPGSLRRMVDIAQQVASAAPRNPLLPVVPSAYLEAIDSIRLSETFAGIANSLKMPRASLVRS